MFIHVGVVTKVNSVWSMRSNSFFLSQALVSQFLEEHVLFVVSALREKYEGCSDVIRQGQQVRE